MLKVEKMPKKTTFRLRNREIFPNTILSPMDGVTDAPFRRLCRVLSGNRMGLLVSEFVPTNADAVFSISGHKQLKFFPEEQPFGVQIFGCYPDKMAEAARKIEAELHPAFIEVNAGCPAPKVAGKGSGSGLLRDLPRLAEILHEVKGAISVPLTLKCRIGWDDNSINVMDTLDIAESEGVELLVVHGRTRLQGYNGLANWDWIGKVASAAKIPVVGNGDVNSVESAFERIQTYGVDGVSIGRGAMHNPWIFGQIADAWEGKPEREISVSEALDVFPLYHQFKLEDGATEMGSMGRLKQLAARLCKGFVDVAHDSDEMAENAVAMQIRQMILTSTNVAELFDRIKMIKDKYSDKLKFDPARLVNLNGAKETELKFGDHYKAG